jgi:hypothetical protein
MDDIVKPRGSPRPRRQNAAIKTLREDAPATQNGAAMEAARHDHEPTDRPAIGKLVTRPDTDCGYALSSSHIQTSARLAGMAHGDQRGRAITDGALHHETARNKRADGRRVCCMMLIHCETKPGRVRISSKVSQSPFSAPIKQGCQFNAR